MVLKMSAPRIGIIGVGKLGEALIYGLLRAKVLTPDRLLASDVSLQRCSHISATYNVSCSSDNVHVAGNSQALIIAVKPKDVKRVLEGIRGTLTSSHLVVSVAAGISLNYIASILGSNVQVVRVMPNMPVLVGEGMTVIAAAPNVTRENLAVAEEIFRSVGKVAFADEKYMDAVTGLSGSGPAYIYFVIEALTDAGVKVGLPRELSSLLATQTTLGAARMVLETGEHPAKLRDMVATPGGVTVEGLAKLEEGKLRMTFINAVVKATQRSKELLIAS